MLRPFSQSLETLRNLAIGWMLPSLWLLVIVPLLVPVNLVSRGGVIQVVAKSTGFQATHLRLMQPYFLLWK
ncbi:hypothetical protein D3C71_2047260 [compost metagenome]